MHQSFWSWLFGWWKDPESEGDPDYPVGGNS
jgi:hypothetical protein